MAKKIETTTTLFRVNPLTGALQQFEARKTATRYRSVSGAELCEITCCGTAPEPPFATTPERAQAYYEASRNDLPLEERLKFADAPRYQYIGRQLVTLPCFKVGEESNQFNWYTGRGANASVNAGSSYTSGVYPTPEEAAVPVRKRLEREVESARQALADARLVLARFNKETL